MSDVPLELRQIEPELLQRLGLIVVRWSLIEGWVADLFVRMTGGDGGSMMVVTSNVSQSTLIGWIRTLLDSSQTHIYDADKIRNVLTEIDDIRIERNALVHGIWTTEGPANSAIVQTVRLERSTIIREEVVTTADLDDLAQRIVEVATHFREILRAFNAYP